ncbi:putative selenate ABC transporter substrate-binding protein [Bacillaceae bacterium]
MLTRTNLPMKRLRKHFGIRLALFAAFVLLLSLLAACSPSNDAGDAQQGEGAGQQAEAEKEGNAADAGEPFRVAVIPAQNTGNFDQAMERLEQVLAEKLGREVTIEKYPDYNGVVEAMNYGQIDMAYLGPLTYVIAHHENGAEAIVTQLIDGKPYYYSYIITHKDNPWQSLDDLLQDPGKVSFAFGDPNSTSGSLIPGLELKERGVYTDESNHKFKDVRFTGSHDVTALAVQNKEVDAGAIDSAIYDMLVEQGKVDGEQIKIIWQSEKLFQYPWAVKKGTDPETIEKLREAFIGIKDKEILDAFGATGFTKAEDKDYETIRQAAEKDGRLK